MLTRVELIFVVLMVSALILIAYEMLKGLFQSICTIFDQKKSPQRESMGETKDLDGHSETTASFWL